MKSQKTRVFIVEEHHEAYIVWKHAIKNKLIKSENNTLLHIDEHSDMSPPTLNVSIHDLNGNLTQIKNFTYSELNIASFIIPAVYEKIFNRIFWIRQRHDKARRKGNDLYVRSFNNTGKKLITGKRTLLDPLEKEDSTITDGIIPFQFYKQHIDRIGKMKDVLLDIDLDYFSCVVNPLKQELNIEITKEEYLNFKNNLYHRINYFDFIRVDARMIGEKYYYCLNHFETAYKSPLQVESSKIVDRIQLTAKSLHEKEIKPQIITICRSRYSGYTPGDQWEFIERELIEELGKVYDLEEPVHISSIK